MGPVKASNLPDNFDPTPGYPTVFQARTLQREGEKQKIRKIARNLDPDRLLLHHSDPTFGTPVVWEGDGKTHKVGTQSILTPKGTYYVLGGNGRLMAILMAPTDRFQAYVQRGRSLWPDIWPAGSAPDGERRVLVRVATKVNGDPLTFQEARKLAGRTQQSPAGEESPIGKSLSLIRSLGLEQVSDLPQFVWDRLITQDNVEDFMAENRGYTEAVLNSMGKARAESYQQDPALMAQLFNNLMVGYLPKRFHLRGFVGEKQERALLSALPIVVAIHQGVETGDVLPKWDLFPLLDGAERFSTLVKGITNNKAISMVEQAAAQVQLGEGTALETKFQSLFDDLPLLAVMFGLVLKKGERARDPAITISDLLVPYAAQALGTGDDEEKLEQGARQTGMLASIAGRYGEPDQTVDPAEYLAKQLKVELPKRVRAQGGPSLFERVANPPPTFARFWFPAAIRNDRPGAPAVAFARGIFGSTLARPVARSHAKIVPAALRASVGHGGRLQNACGSARLRHSDHSARPTCPGTGPRPRRSKSPGRSTTNVQPRARSHRVRRTAIYGAGLVHKIHTSNRCDFGI